MGNNTDKTKRAINKLQHDEQKNHGSQEAI